MKNPSPHTIIALGLLWAAGAVSVRAADHPLRGPVERIAASAGGHVGVAMMDLETRETFLFNGHDRFPMQSVYKFPFAMAVLEQVDRREALAGAASARRVGRSAAGHLQPAARQVPAGERGPHR